MNGQQLAPGGRGQRPAAQDQQNAQAALLMQNGINRGMNPAQFQALQQPGGPGPQQKSIQGYAQDLALHHSRPALGNQGMPNGVMGPNAVMPNQSDLVPIPDGQGMYPMNEYYAPGGQPMAQLRAGMQTPANQHGNHALHDYQMQLMLLEQQNKRRLMMARQDKYEQDNISRDGQPPAAAPPPPPHPPPSQTMGAGGIQGGGNRSGNQSEQIKRGTPKMPQAGLPGSPSAGESVAQQNRGSPAAMNFNGPPEMTGPFFVKGMPEGMVGPNGIRPPSSNPGGFNGPQIGQSMTAAPGSRGVPGGNWQPQQGQPMPPQQSPVSQQQPGGTPQERAAMPPPQPPPAGATGNNAGRASPQTGSAAPTSQQTTKPPPKKKEPKETKRRPSKKASVSAVAANANQTAATPSSEAEPPPTPTPSTPITPQHPSSFNKTGGASTTASAPPQQPAPQSLVQQQPAPQPLVQQQPEQSQPSFNDINLTDVSNDIYLG